MAIAGNHRRLFLFATRFILLFLLLIWTLAAVQWALQSSLSYLGIYPLKAEGLLGILTAPLVHGDLDHLLGNSFSLLLLGFGVFYFYDRMALPAFTFIYLTTGILVWLFARPAYHIGASGLAYGLLAVLLFQGLFRGHIFPVVISLISLVMFGGMWAGIFPGEDPRISWESHLFGALAGLTVVLYFRKKPISTMLEEAESQEFDSQSSDNIFEEDIILSNSPQDEPLPKNFKYRF